MFTRTLEDDLLKWKNSNLRKPLILCGGRQVGKTSVVRKFGQENFSQVIEINLEKKEQLSVFDKAQSVDDFIKRIGLYFDKKIVLGETLLFIDEVQESKNIMELLRFFAEEKPELHLITAGSLLEAKINKDWTVPVGRVDYYYLYPLTFFEYLEAKGKNTLLERLKKINLGNNFEFEDLTNDLFREYLIIGGMPEVVNSFIKNNNYEEIKTILNRLQTAYLDDIQKYATSKQENKYLELVINNGPKIAGALYNYENFAGSNYRSREMGEALQAVEKVMLLKQIMAINSVTLPITPKSKRPKKMIWLDVGLANFVNNAYKEIITGEYKGKIMEQIVGQNLLAGGTNKQIDLYYWSRNRDEGSAEVDFCLQYETRLVGIEIKSGSVSNMKSLFSLADIENNLVPVRVSWDKLGSEEWKYAGKKYRLLSLPFYLIDRWQDLVKQFIT